MTMPNPAAPTTSYLIPVGDLTLDERRALRENVDELLAAVTGSGPGGLSVVTDIRNLLIRDVLPNTDFGVGIGGPAVGAGTDESWRDQIAGVAGTEHQYFTGQLAIDRCVGFYGISVESAPASISRVRLQLGPAGVVRGVYQLEKLYTRLETAGYFSEAVIFTRNEFVRVMVMPRLAYAALTERLEIMGRTAEPIGGIVSAKSV